MKKLVLSISLAASAVFAYAHPVSVQQAQVVAENFMTGKNAGQNITLQLSQTYRSTVASGQTAMYIFDVNEGRGFVIVSGDDAVTPVLGYSTENIFPAKVTNNEVAYWMKGYNDQISYVITNQLKASPEVAAAWSRLSNLQAEQGHTAAKPTNISPMLSTDWDQMSPYGSGTLLYNNLCPAGTPTGCVATAMAQIMNFWQFPVSGTGSHTYSSSMEGGTLSADFDTTYAWDKMPEQLNTNSTPAQKKAVALLMYHCGVSVEMNYDLAENGGSGAYVINYGYDNVPCSQEALVDYFGYDAGIKGLERVHFSPSTWISKLKTELDEGRPILYTGYGGAGGHAFVFDGYDDGDNEVFFHINWGWSGNSNGYFVINDLSPDALGVGGGGGNFNDGQEALINIKPTVSTSISNPESEFSQILVFPNPASGSIVLDWSKFSGKIAGVQLVNLLGQQVYQNDALIGNVKNIALDGLSAGNYFMRIHTDKGSFTKKITVK